MNKVHRESNMRSTETHKNSNKVGVEFACSLNRVSVAAVEGLNGHLSVEQDVTHEYQEHSIEVQVEYLDAFKDKQR